MRVEDEGRGTQIEAWEFLTHYKGKKGYREGSQTLKTGDHSGCKISCIEVFKTGLNEALRNQL